MRALWACSSLVVGRAPLSPMGPLRTHPRPPSLLMHDQRRPHLTLGNLCLRGQRFPLAAPRRFSRLTAAHCSMSSVAQRRWGSSRTACEWLTPLGCALAQAFPSSGRALSSHRLSPRCLAPLTAGCGASAPLPSRSMCRRLMPIRAPSRCLPPGPSTTPWCPCRLQSPTTSTRLPEPGPSSRRSLQAPAGTVSWHGSPSSSEGDSLKVSMCSQRSSQTPSASPASPRWFPFLSALTAGSPWAIRCRVTPPAHPTHARLRPPRAHRPA